MDFRNISSLKFLLVLGVTTMAMEFNNNDQPFRKVTTSLPSTLSQSELKVHNLSSTVNPVIACGTLCRLDKYCRLFCVQESMCHTFYDHVTEYYPGATDSPYSFSACYSSWYFPNNLAQMATATQDSSYWANGYPASEALLDYTFYPDQFCSYTSNWWLADLGSTKNVAYIVVAPSYNGAHFQNIEIRLGDSADFEQNPLFAFMSGRVTNIDPLQKDIVFYPESDSGLMAGRYLSLKKTSVGNLFVCTVVIVEA